jgi:hypothetical protein
MEALLLPGLRSARRAEIARLKPARQADPGRVLLRLVKPLVHGRTADEGRARANGDDARQTLCMPWVRLAGSER